MSALGLRPARLVASGTAVAVGVFLALTLGGVIVALFFVEKLLLAGNLGALSLPVVALVGGVASTFNPCGLPALFGFLAFGGGAGARPADGRC